jgi:redox-regulated HSP33 family molecular chaperone
MVVQCGLLEQSYQVFQAAYPRTDCLEQLKVALRIVCSIAKANESLQLRLLQDGMLGSILALSISTDESLRHLSKVSDDFVTFLSVRQPRGGGIHQAISDG